LGYAAECLAVRGITEAYEEMGRARPNRSPLPSYVVSFLKYFVCKGTIQRLLDPRECSGIRALRDFL
jgi:hypothetical protein